VADFGIGVSGGPVFAGNIGAKNRYEYTVIGDPVNEAARLADLAKTSDRRMLASAHSVAFSMSATRMLKLTREPPVSITVTVKTSSSSATASTSGSPTRSSQ
jgi:class 3 adenylate cyclase